MKAYQIFQAISPDLGQEIFQTLREEHKDVYKSVLISLAQQKKLRPVFVQRKPASQQIAWLYQTAKLRIADGVTEHLLQLWLLKSKKEMLVAFLDVLEIEHDDEGTVDDLPEELDAAKLKAAVDKLLSDFPAETVTLYLEVFQLQQPGGWQEITSQLESDDRLFLGEKPEPAQDAPAEESAKDEEE